MVDIFRPDRSDFSSASRSSTTPVRILDTCLGSFVCSTTDNLDQFDRFDHFDLEQDHPGDLQDRPPWSSLAGNQQRTEPTFKTSLLEAVVLAASAI